MDGSQHIPRIKMLHNHNLKRCAEDTIHDSMQLILICSVRGSEPGGLQFPVVVGVRTPGGIHCKNAVVMHFAVVSCRRDGRLLQKKQFLAWF